MGIFSDGETEIASNSGDVMRGLDSAQLHDALTAAVGVGWMVSIAGSRDGYSVSLAVFIDGKRESKWHTTVSTLETAVERLQKAAESAGGLTPTEAPPKGRGGARKPKV